MTNKLVDTKQQLKLAKVDLRENKAIFKSADKACADDPLNPDTHKAAKGAYTVFLKAQRQVAKLTQKVDLLSATN